jgi:hypothetical protein
VTVSKNRKDLLCIVIMIITRYCYDEIYYTSSPSLNKKFRFYFFKKVNNSRLLNITDYYSSPGWLNKRRHLICTFVDVVIPKKEFPEASVELTR